MASWRGGAERRAAAGSEEHGAQDHYEDDPARDPEPDAPPAPLAPRQ